MSPVGLLVNDNLEREHLSVQALTRESGKQTNTLQATSAGGDGIGATDACTPPDGPQRQLVAPPTPYFRSGSATLYSGDAADVMATLEYNSVDCVITSPPYYGQRDYRVDGQIGLETNPQVYVDKLVATLGYCRYLLKSGGSLWVVIGDTYWNGKGRPRAEDAKRRHARFDRPQDRRSPVSWCVPKQKLLIPHRFAIAMQDHGWIVRNDHVWHKSVAMPDPAIDRCSVSHEYVFHFVLDRRYYFDLNAVAIQSKGGRPVNPPSVWSVPVGASQKKHPAVFPAQLVRLPILATCPPNGVVLDPFCGSGTTLATTLSLGQGRTAVGIDISPEALLEAKILLSESDQAKRP